MNCRETETLLLAEPDGVLTPVQLTALDQHVAGCRACREFRSALAQTRAALRAEVAAVPVPDADREWQTLRGRLHGVEIKPAKKRPLAPVIWFATPLAAAVAIVLVFFSAAPERQATTVAAPTFETTRAESIDPGYSSAATLVYVDKESGWLVVWAADSGALPAG